MANICYGLCLGSARTYSPKNATGRGETGLAPVRAVDGLPGHETFLLEYDLAAGAGLTQKFAACADAHTEGGPRTCMLIDVEMAGDDRTSGIVRQDIAEVLKTGEVY